MGKSTQSVLIIVAGFFLVAFLWMQSKKSGLASKKTLKNAKRHPLQCSTSKAGNFLGGLLKGLGSGKSKGGSGSGKSSGGGGGNPGSGSSPAGGKKTCCKKPCCCCCCCCSCACSPGSTVDCKNAGISVCCLKAASCCATPTCCTPCSSCTGGAGCFCSGCFCAGCCAGCC